MEEEEGEGEDEEGEDEEEENRSWNHELNEEVPREGMTSEKKRKSSSRKC